MRPTNNIETNGNNGVTSTMTSNSLTMHHMTKLVPSSSGHTTISNNNKQRQPRKMHHCAATMGIVLLLSCIIDIVYVLWIIIHPGWYSGWYSIDVQSDACITQTRSWYVTNRNANNNYNSTVPQQTYDNDGNDNEDAESSTADEDDLNNDDNYSEYNNENSMPCHNND